MTLYLEKSLFQPIPSFHLFCSFLNRAFTPVSLLEGYFCLWYWYCPYPHISPRLAYSTTEIITFFVKKNLKVRDKWYKKTGFYGQFIQYLTVGDMLFSLVKHDLLHFIESLILTFCTRSQKHTSIGNKLELKCMILHWLPKLFLPWVKKILSNKYIIAELPEMWELNVKHGLCVLHG